MHCFRDRREMNDKFETVFEVSYLSNGELLWSGLFLAVGLAAAVLGMTRLKRVMEDGCAVASFVLCCAAWIPFSAWWFIDNLCTTSAYVEALNDGRCEIVEGTVHVLCEEPYSGHVDYGDRIRVEDVQFEFSYYQSSLAYKQTVSHGGSLTDGALVRLHYLGKAILKVEVHGRFDQPVPKRRTNQEE